MRPVDAGECLAFTQYKYMDKRPKHAPRAAARAGGALHNSSVKLLITVVKGGNSALSFCFSSSSWLCPRALHQPLPKQRGMPWCWQILLFPVSVKQAWVKVPKLLPCPELPLFCFPALASCGDVIIPHPWAQPSSQAGLHAGGNEVASETVVVFLTFTFRFSLNYSQTCELSKQGSSFLHKARFSPGLE